MMSYPIVFQTKVVKINDNEIIHFNRIGCNNDTAGRVANMYEAKIRTIEDFKRMGKWKEIIIIICLTVKSYITTKFAPTRLLWSTTKKSAIG